MIKREFGQSEIKVLTSRVQMAEKTVKDGEQLDTDLQRNVINAVDIAVDNEQAYNTHQEYILIPLGNLEDG